MQFKTPIAALALSLFSAAFADEAKSIQSMIDETAAKGGGTVVLPAGEYRTGAVFLKPGVNLHLEKGAHIVGTDDAADYPMMETRIEGETCLYYPALINADHCDGLKLTGDGIIDGHGADVWYEFWTRREAMKKEGKELKNKDLMRPRLLYVSNSKNVEVKGLTFKNSKYWTTHYYQCEDVTVDGCRILAEVLQGPDGKQLKGPSTDAVDIDKCRRFTVKNCYISVNDDGVVVKGGKGAWADDYVRHPENGTSTDVLVENCDFRSPTHAALTLGSECPEASGVTMRNCTVDGVDNMLYLKMRTDTPQHYSNVLVENVTGKCNRFFLAGAWSQYADLGGRTQKDVMSYAKDVTIRNCKVECRKEIEFKGEGKYFELEGLVLEGNEINGKPGTEKPAGMEPQRTQRKQRVEGKPAETHGSEVKVAKWKGNKVAAVSYTLDDGIIDQYTLAFPKFKELGLKATFFLNGGPIDNQKPTRQGAARITWEMAKEMADAGMEIASHGYNHVNHGRFPEDAVEEDIVKNEAAIEKATGARPLTYAFPNNAKNKEWSYRLLRDHGYAGWRSHQKSLGGHNTVESADKMVADAKKDGSWRVFMTHGIDVGYDHWDHSEEFWKHLAHVAADKDLWVDTFLAVSVYERLRDATRVEAEKTEKGWHVKVAAPELDKALYQGKLDLVMPDGKIVEFDPFAGDFDL